MKCFVIIPAFNEGERIESLVREIGAFNEDILVVDDGSTDGTSESARSAGAHVLHHRENRGKGEALKTGFRYALSHKADAVITLDGDGQHDWREIAAFLQEARKEDAGIILGTRMRDVRGMPFVRLLTNLVTSWIVSRISRQRISDSQSGYRLIQCKVLRSLYLQTSNYDLESEILIKASRAGYRIKEIPIKTLYGKNTSKIHPWRDTVRFVRLVWGSMFGGR